MSNTKNKQAKFDRRVNAAAATKNPHTKIKILKSSVQIHKGI